MKVGIDLTADEINLLYSAVQNKDTPENLKKLIEKILPDIEFQAYQMSVEAERIMNIFSFGGEES